MNRRLAPTILVATALAGCAQLIHVPPGTSVEFALARKPEVMRMPPTATTAAPGAPRVRDLHLPPVEPTLPTNDSVTSVAEAFTRGNEALERGRNDEAITAFQQAVQGDPKFSEAWQKLAMAYEKAGKPDKAREAYKHSKDTMQQ